MEKRDRSYEKDNFHKTFKGKLKFSAIGWVKFIEHAKLESKVEFHCSCCRCCQCKQTTAINSLHNCFI